MADTSAWPDATVHGARPCQRTILQFEDNASNALLVEALIARRSDLTIFTAGNANQVVAVTCSRKPDVIIMDMKMPGICGVDALKLLLANPLTAAIPVIALSSNAYPGEIRMCLDAGFFRYLTKPFKLSDLMDAIDAALNFAEEGRPRVG